MSPQLWNDIILWFILLHAVFLVFILDTYDPLVQIDRYMLHSSTNFEVILLDLFYGVSNFSLKFLIMVCKQAILILFLNYKSNISILVYSQIHLKNPNKKQDTLNLPNCTYKEKGILLEPFEYMNIQALFLLLLYVCPRVSICSRQPILSHPK